MDIQAIILAVITALLGGGLGRIITLRSTKREANSKADQAEKNTEALTLKNTNEIVELYKKAMHDMQVLSDKREQEFQVKIDQQNELIKKQSEQLEEYNRTQIEQQKVIDKLTATQGLFKLEIERLKKLSLDTCSTCEFKDMCAKYKAKQELDKTIRALHDNDGNGVSDILDHE